MDEEGCVVVSAKPIEDLEDGSDKHDERDVEGEAIGGAGTGDGEDLVGVGCYGGGDEAGKVSVIGG